MHHLLLHLTPEEAYVLFTFVDDPDATVDLAALLAARNKLQAAHKAYVERVEHAKNPPIQRKEDEKR